MMCSTSDGNPPPSDVNWTSATKRMSLRHGALRQLTDAYDRCMEIETDDNLVLISGPSGVGKTTLALEIKELAAANGGYVISGKFDQLEANWLGSSSYGPFVDAFTEYIDMTVEAGQDSLASLRTALEANMDRTELHVLMDMIPSLQRVSSELMATERTTSERSSVIKGPDAEKRFVRVFCQFVRSICSLGHPIVLFLDDIQWANQSEMLLLSSLAELHLETMVSCLMILCTIRSDEVTPEHLVSIGLEEMRKQGIVLSEIQLSNMVSNEVHDLISEALPFPFNDMEDLSKRVFDQTNGNLLFVIMLVEAMLEDGIIQRSGSFRLDPDRLQNFLSAFRSLSRLFVRIILKLPEHAQEHLKTASCLGPSFSQAVLAPMEIVDSESLWSVLSEIEEAGLIHLEHDSHRGGRFVHDRVQKAAYTLVPQAGRAALHLEIGRRLWKSAPRSQHDEHLLLIAQQVSRGVDLIYDPFEKDDLAEMFYKAGQKAAISSAFGTAGTYLDLGIELLSRRHWRQQYQLSLRLYNLCAEIQYYNGKLQRMDDLIATIFTRARCFEDKLRAHFTRIYSLGSRNETEKALDESLEVLKCMGETFPRKPNLFHLNFGILRLCYYFWGKSKDDILNLAAMADPKKLTTMRLMCIMVPYAFYTRTMLSVLVTFRMIEFTLRYGLSDMASYGFASLSVASVYGGNLRNAARFSKLALETLNKCQNMEWKARVIVSIWSVHYPLLFPFRDGLEHLKDAHRSGLVVGDIYFSVLSTSVYCGLAFAAGSPLPGLVDEMRKYHTLCKQYSQFSVMASLGLQMQLGLNLMGQADNLLVLTGSAMNESEVLKQMETSNHLDLVRLHIFKLMLATYLNDHSAARELCAKLRRFDKIKNIPFSTAAQMFYEGLTVAQSSSSSIDKRRVKFILGKLKSYAQTAPCNYLHRVCLVEAELASSSNVDGAIEKYDMAIHLSRQEGLIHEQALACERKAHSLTRHKRHPEARVCLEQACSLYEQWGAKAKVDQILALIRQRYDVDEHDDS